MTTDVALALKITNSFKPPRSMYWGDLIWICKGSSFESRILQAKSKAAVPGGAERGTFDLFLKWVSWPK
jgi:hypothetical protein